MGRMRMGDWWVGGCAIGGEEDATGAVNILFTQTQGHTQSTHTAKLRPAGAQGPPVIRLSKKE